MAKGVNVRVGGGRQHIRTPSRTSKSYTYGTRAQPAKPASVTKAGKVIPSVPAVAATPAITTYVNEPSQTEYSQEPTATFRVPVTVVFITGLSLIIVNNTVNGRLKLLWDLIWDSQPVSDPVGTFAPVGGELLFVIIMSFIAEINDQVSGVVFALFVGVWMVWSINNASTISGWAKSLGVNTTTGQPISTAKPAAKPAGTVPNVPLGPAIGV